MGDERIKQSEFQQLFGDNIPMEAIQLVFGDGSENMTVAEARVKLREIAARHKTGVMPEVIKQHLGWIAGYCACATDGNWRDILDRIEHQIQRAQEDAERNVLTGNLGERQQG